MSTSQLSIAEKNFAANIERLRVERGLSHVEIASEAGVSRSYWYKLASAEQSPTLGVMERIAKALHVPLAELFESPQKTKT